MDGRRVHRVPALSSSDEVARANWRGVRDSNPLCLPKSPSARPRPTRIGSTRALSDGLAAVLQTLLPPVRSATHVGMPALLPALAAAVRAVFCQRADLVLENLALRRQLAILARRRPRPRLSALDRAFWAGLAKLWPGWRDTLAIVRPATVIRWQRLGFRLFWRWRSRPTGRPSTKADTRMLIRRIASENPGWGAPRIHGELLKLGIAVARSTIAKYMPRRCQPPSPTWRTFLHNDMSCAAGIDFLRRLGCEEEVVGAPRSPWQNPFVERVIGSIRRDLLDHLIVLGEGHARRLLRRYAEYYNSTRTHLSLAKDSPDGRAVSGPEHGPLIVSRPILGGLHHRYQRAA